MATVFPGRFTARSDEPFVVFLIGMRVNRFLSFRKWIPVAKAMPPMIEELRKQPELGFLHAEFLFFGAVWQQCSIGGVSNNCMPTRMIGARSICRPGQNLIVEWEQMGLWESGTRRTLWGPVNTRRSM